jgi:hypothetical protein
MERLSAPANFIGHADTKLVEGGRIGTLRSLCWFDPDPLAFGILASSRPILISASVHTLLLRSAMLSAGAARFGTALQLDQCIAPTQISRLLLLAAAHFCGVATRPNAIQRCREAPDRIHLRA